jgi:hypothetical protein
MSHPSVHLLTFPRSDGTIVLQPAEPFVQGLPRQARMARTGFDPGASRRKKQHRAGMRETYSLY